jgi:Avidin family
MVGSVSPFAASGSWRGLVRRALLSAACLVAASTAGLAQSFQPNAVWTNKNGSTLTIKRIAPDGSFTGSYVSHGTGSCQGDPFPVIGWIDGQKVSFIVHWANAKENCQAITSWTGYLERRGVLLRWIRVEFGITGNTMMRSGTQLFR